MKNTGFYVEKVKDGVLKGKYFLRNNGGHCHQLSSITSLLESNTFKRSNCTLVPIFEKAKKMIENNEVGSVFI